jgi:hypothetical protein
MEPGIELARVLAGLESSSLSSAERVTVITACRRMVSHYQAMSYREIWTLLSSEADQSEDAAFLIVSEIGAALHLTNRGAQIELERALGLERAPSVFAALLRGKLDLYRTQLLIDRTCHLPDRDLTWVVSQVIEEAEYLTASQIRGQG